jgi:hypothetical protein
MSFFLKISEIIKIITDGVYNSARNISKTNIIFLDTKSSTPSF